MRACSKTVQQLERRQVYVLYTKCFGDRKQAISSFATRKPVQSIFYLSDMDMLTNTVHSNNSSTASDMKAFKV